MAGELGHLGNVERDTRAGRLDHGQRREPLAERRRREQGDHAAVGMTDEMISLDDVLRDPLGVPLGVDGLDRPRGETGPLGARRARPRGRSIVVALAIPGGLRRRFRGRVTSLGARGRQYVTNLAVFRLCTGDRTVTSRVVCSGRMAAATASSPHSLMIASGLLLGTTGLAMGVGALLGWLFDAPGIGC